MITRATAETDDSIFRIDDFILWSSSLYNLPIPLLPSWRPFLPVQNMLNFAERDY
jgi:hypothetical protein